MAKLVFRLNQVPEEEADSVRTLLTEAGMEFYETQEGRWGLSVGGIWLKNNEDFAAARALIDEFQREHQQKMRAQFEADKSAGNIPTFWQLLRANPVAMLGYWAIILFILFVSIVPIYRFFNPAD